MDGYMSEAKQRNGVAPEKVELESMDVVWLQRQRLRELFPEVVSEGGKVDFDKLRLTLGDIVDEGKERYGLSWAGKADCYRTIQRPSLATLLPERERSVNFDSTKNIIIEGDNLEVLKLLQKSYLGKVQVIYIDPPYNTGSDFIYPDDYSETLDTYLKYSGQVDEGGRHFSSNSETSGRFHSRWLSMIFSRIFLARNLLADNGFIFVSIDDHEIENLKKVMNEIFGEECFKGCIVRATGQTVGQDSGTLGSSFDYVLVYSKNPDTEVAGVALDDDDIERFSEEDERGKYAYWQLRKTGNHDRREERPNMFFPITAPDGTQVLPIGPGGYESRWRCGPERYKELVRDNMIIWKKVRFEGGERWWAYQKYYLEGRTKRSSPLWDDIAGSKKATRDLKELFGDKVFTNPKPVELITRLLQLVLESKDALVLDFFAGSGTTAEAVLAQNKADGGSRRFILVQLPEPTGKPSLPKIADVTRERVRRVIDRLLSEQQSVSQSSLFGTSTANRDYGFRSFRLAQSNFQQWEGSTHRGADELQRQLALQVRSTNSAATQEGVLFEILLKSGFEISVPIASRSLGNSALFSVMDGGLLVYLEQSISRETIQEISKLNPARVVVLDSSFAGNDQLKVNAVETFKAKGITFKTV